MQTQSYFKAATLLYHQGNHQQAIVAINRYLHLKPSNSMAFNNRALIQLQLGQISAAKEDILHALQLNHLNYVAYFNLFSVYSQQGQFMQSLLSLQAGLSCLYLIKGRLLKDKQLLQKALCFSPNNVDALLLLVLFQVREGDYRQALRLVEGAKSLKENISILQKLVEIIKELLTDYSEELEESAYDLVLQCRPNQPILSGKAMEVKGMIEEEVKIASERAVATFNQLYGQLNRRLGGVSYLIAKNSQNNSCPEEQAPKTCEAPYSKKQEIMTMQ